MKSGKICFWNTFAEILYQYKICLQINLVVLRTTSKHLRFCWHKVSDKKEYKIKLYFSFPLHICNVFRLRYKPVPKLQWTFQYNLNFFIILFFHTIFFSVLDNGLLSMVPIKCLTNCKAILTCTSYGIYFLLFYLITFQKFVLNGKIAKVNNHI